MESSILETIKNLKHAPLPQRSKEEIDNLVVKLMAEMTLEEKIGQLYQSAPPEAHVEGMEFKEGQQTISYIKDGQCGSILGISDPISAYHLQRVAVEESRLKIPLFFGFDIIHGCRTAFPINLAMACSFDPALLEETCKVAAYEAAHMGISLTFSPMVDLVRDPRWGRVMESNGEDPYLNYVLARAYVRGYQQNKLADYHTIGACIKHFAGYGASEAGKEYNTVDISDHHLRTFYLPGYKACVDENAASIMTSFNVIDGIPATCNKRLLTDILRDEWKYEGFVISDYSSSMELLNHKVARDEKEVAYRCLSAGLDHEMVSMSYVKYLKELVDERKIDEEMINRACQRVLKFKYQTGLFDNPYKNIYYNTSDYVQKEEFRKIALQMALKSIVLLKNKNQVLPIKTNQKISLIGPFAKHRGLVGAWGGLCKEEECVTLHEGMQGVGMNPIVSQGCAIEHQDTDTQTIEEAYKSAINSDVIIVAIGEKDTWSGESASRSNIGILGSQKQLVARLKTLNKPIIGVIFSGRPLDLVWYEEQLDGIIQAWFLGNEAGNAIAKVVKGEYNPSGKLTMSFPYTVGQIPVYYNHYNTGRPSDTGGPEDTFKSSYLDIPNAPLYCFGHGLSYTTFKYDNLMVDKEVLIGDEIATVTMEITNTGSYAGEETAQLYIECEVFSVTRPMKELKGFKKTWLEVNETKTVEFTLNKEDLAYLNIDKIMTPEDTTYKIFVGTDSTTKDYKIIKYQSHK